MAGASSLTEAFRRLEGALDLVENALERREEAKRQIEGMETELHRVTADRSRLAQSLDAAEARAAKLEEASREASHRIVNAMESIRGVLERHGAA